MTRNQPAADSCPHFRVPLHHKAAAVLMAAITLAAGAPLWQPHSVSAQDAPAPNTLAFYSQRVQPILQANCYRCHGGEHHRGHFSMATRAGLLRGGMDGSVVVPGNAAQSLLLRLVRHEGPADDPMPMPPPPRHKLSDADIATLAQWIQAGMIMPPDPPAK